MSKKLSIFGYVILYILSALIFFVSLGSRLLQIGRNYGDAFFPVTYPIVGGYFIPDWTPWFSGVGFILGWLYSVLFRKNNEKKGLTIPKVVGSAGLLILLVATISAREEIWRYILASMFDSMGFGVMISFAEDKLQQLRDS